MVDLTICQECKVNPATYGDGATWSLCSACKLKKDKAAGVEPVQSQPAGESFEHKIVPGLVSVILPVYMMNYTLFHYTGNCIGALREHTPEEFELVVIDNGSPQRPPSPNAYYAAKVIQNEENLGVTKAWNQGIRMSVGEYIVLLNNDVQVYDHWLDDLKEAIDHNGCDLVMAHPMYSMTEPFARALESKAIREKNRYNDGAQFSKFKDFSCVMFKRSLIDEIGLFDERFFNYCSDQDFFRRMDEAGKKYTCVETVATSHISDATGVYIKKTPEIMEKDKAAYEEKWAGIPNIVSLTPDDIKGDYDFKDTELIRVTNGGDPLYLRKGITVRQIADPETLKALDYDFGMERSISKEEFDTYKKGEKITMQNIKEYIAHE